MSNKITVENFDKQETMGVIKAGTVYPVCLLWNGNPCWFILRMLNTVQMRSCGDFSVLEACMKKEKSSTDTKTMPLSDLKDIMNMQLNMAKLAMVSPTYEEVMSTYNDMCCDIKKELENIRSRLNECTDEDVRKNFSDQIELLEVVLQFPLPDDFRALLVAEITQMNSNHTDVMLLTEDILFESAILAERGNDNPSNHIEGSFTDFVRNEIDKKAWSLLAEYRKKQEQENNTHGRKWIGGGGKSRGRKPDKR